MRTAVRFPGHIVRVVAPAAVTTGSGVLVGALFGVALTDAASGAEVDIALDGEFSLPKASGDTISAGARVFWDAANARITTTATGNFCIGATTQAAASGTTTARVVLGPRTAAGA